MKPSTRVIPARDRRRISIGALLVSMVAIQLVLVVGLIGFAASQDFRQANNRAIDSVRTDAAIGADVVAKAIQPVQAEFASIGNYQELLNGPGICKTYDGISENHDGLLTRFHLLNPDGTGRCPGHTKNYGAFPWFKSALTSAEPSLHGPIIDPFTHKNSLVLVGPIGPLVIAETIDLGSIGVVLDNRWSRETPRTTFVVTSRDRSTELASSGGTSGRKLAGSSFAIPLRHTGATLKDLDGTDRIYAESSVVGLGWHLFAGISTRDAIAEAKTALGQRVLFGVLVLVILFATALLVQRRLVRPIRSLVSATRKFGKGDLQAQVEPSGPAELAELGDSLNAMLVVRAEAEAALRRGYRAERKASTQLREMDRMRNAFLMAISHELRTPLTSVVGFSSMLKESQNELSAAEVAKCIDAISSQAKRLEGLLLDLLDIERLGRGVIEPRRMETDVRSLVSAVVDRSAANGRVTVRVTGRATSYIDPALTERIVENLVANAIKHTSSKTKIWVKAARQNGSLKLSVEDAGEGIPDETKLAIFEPFRQGGEEPHASGTGIGLALVSQFAKLQGGQAWVEDRRGGGSAFHVTLPAGDHTQASSNVPAAKATKRKA